jgi:hypothetical protein
MNESVYKVQKLHNQIRIDGDWYKQQWKNVNYISISNFMGCIPSFHPITKAKVLYDDNNLYVIYQVNDCYVSCTEKSWNGPVSNDACVEFFFSPNNKLPEEYFNLEVNANGIPLMRYNIVPRTQFTTLEPTQINEIEFAHSLPSFIDQEITEPVTWTLEYRIPFILLEKFSCVSRPKPGIDWRANFYKTAAKGSNPHWITWSPIDSERPDFHLPQFFGMLRFV